MMISGVYIILNTLNGKFYIGSSKDIEYRWSMHRSALRKNKHHSNRLQNAWNKYGEENFEFSVLSRCPLEYLVRLEQWFLNSLKPEYNILKNAYSVIGLKHSIETKDIISKKLKEYFKENQVWNKGKKMNEESRIKMINSRKGKGMNKRTKRWSEEARKNASERIKGRKLSDITKEKLSKKVTKLSMEGTVIEEYTSISCAARENGITITGISKVCRGKQEYAGDFKWQFSEKTK